MVRQAISPRIRSRPAVAVNTLMGAVVAARRRNHIHRHVDLRAVRLPSRAAECRGLIEKRRNDACSRARNSGSRVIETLIGAERIRREH